MCFLIKKDKTLKHTCIHKQTHTNAQRLLLRFVGNAVIWISFFKKNLLLVHHNIKYKQNENNGKLGEERRKRKKYKVEVGKGEKKVIDF